jgi:prefoldin subunit 5
MTREEIIATASRITELRAKIAELNGLQKELRRLEAELDTVTGVTPEAAPARQRQGLSIEDKIWQILENGADREWSADELAQQIGAKLLSVRASLSKLRKAEKIIDTRRGHVQAKTAAPAATGDSTEGDSRPVAA